MFYLLFAIVGAVMGYLAAPRIGADPMVAGGLGLVGGLVGGVVVKLLFPIVIGIIGALIGAAILLAAYRQYSKRA